MQQQFAQYGMGNVPAETLEKYAKEILSDSNNRQRLAQQSLEFKVYNAIKDNVTLDEKDVTIDEFRALFAPAAEEAAAE